MSNYIDFYDFVEKAKNGKEVPIKELEPGDVFVDNDGDVLIVGKDNSGNIDKERDERIMIRLRDGLIYVINDDFSTWPIKTKLLCIE